MWGMVWESNLRVPTHPLPLLVVRYTQYILILYAVVPESVLRELGIFGLSREMRDHGTLEVGNFVASVNDFAPLAEGTAAGMGQALQIAQDL